MIQQISLKNFQAHKETTLDISPGITAIVGSSDAGKTSILRALYWVLQNKPGGMQMVSFWNRKKDGSPKGETSATIIVDGKAIKRVRNSELNGYTMDDKELSAIGRDVPESVTAFLNLSDINIAKQHDQHFLLSESSGEVARRLNELVRLDIIDETLSKVEKLKRENKKNIEAVDERIKVLGVAVSLNAWIDKAEALVLSLKSKEEEVLKKRERATALNMRIDEVTKVLSLITRYSEIVPKARYLTISTEKLQQSYFNAIGERTKLYNILQDYAKYSKVFSLYEDSKKAKKRINEIEALVEKKEKALTKIKDVRGTINKIKSLDVEKNNMYISIKALKLQMPTTCPTCGQKMEC